jgi:cyclopropane fatty-acyl-phospholipid synthase-like methyltransferase
VTPIDPGRLVRESYDMLGRRYSDWAGRLPGESRGRYRDVLLKDVPPGSRLLDLGCGDGSLLTRELATCFRVTGVDLSPVQLRLARRAIPTATFICSDMTALHLPAESFDAVTSFYSLNHVPRDLLPGLLASIRCWLRPGGLFVGSFGSSDDPGTVETGWLGAPMYFSSYEPAANRAILKAAGLDVLSDRMEATDEDGTRVMFQWVVSRRLPE